MTRTLFLGLGSLLVGTALRAQLDLGDLLPAIVEWSALLAGAAALAAAWRTDTSRIFRSGAVHALALLLVAAACFDGRPAMLVAAGALALGAAASSAGSKRLAAWLVRAALSVVVAWYARLGLEAFALWRMPTGPLGDAIAQILSLFGAEVGSRADHLVFGTVRGSRALILSPTVLGFSVLLPMWLIAVISQERTESTRSRWSNIALVSGIVGAAALVRFIALLAVLNYLDGQAPYEDVDFPIAPLNHWGVSSALDAVAIVVAVAAYGMLRSDASAAEAAEPEAESAPIPTRYRWAAACTVLAGVGLGFPRVADALGTPNGGRILIDEGHSAWEPTDLRLDREVYGQESGYNFRTLVDWLQAGYGSVQRNYDDVTDEVLADVGTLVIKTPTIHYSESEIDAILAFVEDGGGLILIGDHTNVFGTGAVLNEFGERLGFRFDYDSVFDERQRFEQVYRRSVEQRSHPILASVPKIRFEVGCSIDLNGPQWNPVIVGRGLKNLPIDYKASNFYPSVKDASYMRFGQMVEQATRSYGSGRIAILSDSTLLSSFSVMLPGRRELVESMVDWVGRGDVGSAVRTSFVLVGALSALAALLLLLGGGGVGIALALAAGLATSAVAGGIAEARRSPAAPIADVTEDRAIHFYTGSDTAFWPIDQFVRDHDRSFSLFFQWTLRVGAFPRVEANLDRALEEARVLVLVDPPASDSERAAEIVDFARRGGVVVALQTRPNALVEDIAERAALRSPGRARSFEASVVKTPWGPIDLGAGLSDLVSLDGARALMTAIDSKSGKERCVLGRTSVGDGHVIVGTHAALLTDAAYGTKYSSIPDTSRRRLFEVQFSMFASILDITSHRVSLRGEQ